MGLIMATKQETFDTVVAHLRSQGAKSASEDGRSCLYRGPNGLKCAVGALISDDDYSADMESWPANWSNVADVIRDTHDIGLCCDLQTVHDDIAVSEWESALRECASTHELVYRAP